MIREFSVTNFLSIDSKQELNFTDITRKEKRRLKKNKKNLIESAGDYNG